MKTTQAYFLILVALLAWSQVSPAATPEAIFSERIMPIFNSPNPSSCIECHLSGVDLKNYILPTAEKTFTNLRDLGLIDLKSPEKSEILRFIRMDPDSEQYAAISSKRINPELRKAELEAFATWIIAAAADPKFRQTPALSKEATNPSISRIPAAVIRHGRTDQLLKSFKRKVWALRLRCAACHIPGGKKFKKYEAKHGFKKMAWLKAQGPAESMQHLMDGKLLNLEKPEQSELLLKALDEAEEEHGGGVKMKSGDSDYLAILDWIQDYANVINEKYQKKADLPTGLKMTGSDILLKFTDLPENLAGQTMWLAVYSTASPNNSPIALSAVSGKKSKAGVIANGFLMLRGEVDRASLKPGSYVVKLYQAAETTATAEAGNLFNWDKALVSATLIFSREIKADWIPGYGQATVVKVNGESKPPLVKIKK